MITSRRRQSHPFDDEVWTDGGQIRFALSDMIQVSVSFISRYSSVPGTHIYQYNYMSTRTAYTIVHYIALCTLTLCALL